MMRPMFRGWAAVLSVGAFAAAAFCLAAEPVHVRLRDPRLMVERLSRRLDWRDGLPVSYVVAAMQDREGFLWVAGSGGLSRYDGSGFTTVYPRGTTLISGCAQTGRVILWIGTGLGEIVGDDLVDLQVPGSPKADAEWAASVAADGGVWWLLDGRLYRKGAGGWVEIKSPAPPDDPVRRLHAGNAASVFVWSRDVIRLVAPDGTAREVARLGGIRVAIERADGSIVLGANGDPGPVTTRVFEVRDGKMRLLFERVGWKVLDLAMRGD